MYFFFGDVYGFLLDRVGGVSVGVVFDGVIFFFMFGCIIVVEVVVGDSVIKGQKFVMFEVMKMEYSFVVLFDGMVEMFDVIVGGQVSEGVVLVKIGVIL